MTQPVQPLDLDTIQTTLAAATEGEWSLHPDWPGRVFSTDRHVARATGYNAEANAAAIVAAHNALPALIARVRELEQLVTDVSALLPAHPADDISASWISPRLLRAALRPTSAAHDAR